VRRRQECVVGTECVALAFELLDVLIDPASSSMRPVLSLAAE
jgi:hypothetical protein